MKEKCYYVEDAETRELYEIKIKDVEYLANFALMLDPEEEVTEAFCYASALAKYYENNDDIYKDRYLKLVSSNYGSMFLCANINLALLEHQFRSEGVDEKNLGLYEKELSEYHRLLKFNNNTFDGEKHNIR